MSQGFSLSKQLCKVLCNEEHVDLYPTISYYKARHHVVVVVVVVLILILILVVVVVVVVVVRQPSLVVQAMVIPIRIVVVRDV